MKQTKSTIKKQHRTILQESDNLDLNSFRIHKEFEDALKRAGIERPSHGPKITDPAHTRSEIYR